MSGKKIIFKRGTLVNIPTLDAGEPGWATDGGLAGTGGLYVGTGAGNILINDATAILDTDVTLAADSDTKIASQHAVKTYADVINTNANTKVAKSLYDANTILAANSDDTPAAVTVATNRIVGRAAGNITALTGAEVRAITGNLNQGAQVLNNISIAASVAAAALTVALKGEDGTDPSASNVVSIGFRDETLTTGTPNVRTVTGALSVVLASGGTLGFTAALAGRIYVWAIDNAGTVELALSRTADIFPESNLVTTVAIGAGSDLATAMYSTTQRTSLACRCIGYIEITTGAVAGEWDNAPTKIQVMGPGVKRTGDVIQNVWLYTQTGASGSTQTPRDGSVPQITEGDEYMTQAVTFTSAINMQIVEVKAFVASAAQHVTGALHKVGTNDAIAYSQPYTHGNYTQEHLLVYRGITGSVAAMTYTFRAGGGGAGDTYFNSDAGGYLDTGYGSSYINIQELFA